MGKIKKIVKKINENQGYECIQWTQKEKVIRLTVASTICDLLNSLENNGLLSKKMKPFVEVHYYRVKGKKSKRGSSFFYEIYTGLSNGRMLELLVKDAVIGEDMEMDTFKEFVIQKAFSTIENNDRCWVKPFLSLEDEKINHFFEELQM